MYIDFHCDTLMLTAKRDFSDDLYDNKKTAVDFRRMKEGGQSAQFFAIFMDTKERMEEMNVKFPSDEDYIAGRLESAKENLSRHLDLAALATNYETLKKNQSEGKLSMFLTFEEGRVLDNSLDKLKYYYDEGIRLITLTWNYENCLGFPNSHDSEKMNKGLKPFGRDTVVRMKELGMLVDVSHLSDGGFWDVAKLLDTPFIASHSNCRDLDFHPRNLTDDMLREIANHGGVVGLNFAPSFLNQSQIPDAVKKWNGYDKRNIIVYSRISDMIRHLDHMKDIGGEEIVALGSDLDGIGGELEISSPLDFDKLFNALKKSGWSEEQIDKLAYKNAERIIKDVLI